MTAPNYPPEPDDGEDALERQAIQQEAEPARNRNRLTEAYAREEEKSRTWARYLRPAPAEWFTERPPARTWLLRDGRRDKAPGLLPLGKAGMVIGEGGGGKTMVLCQLAIAVATGTPFLGTFPVATTGRVLLVLGEEDASEAHRRLYNAAQAGGPAPEEGSIVVVTLAGVPCAMLETDECGNPRETKFARWLFAYVDGERAAGRGFTLIALDPLSRFAGPEAEKDNAQATRFVQCVERLTVPDAQTALVAHHNNKLSRGGAVGTSDGRGSSAFGDGLRWVATLTPSDVKAALEDPEERDRLGELVTLAVTKSNYSRKGDPLTLRRDPDRSGALVPLDDSDRATVDAARTAPGKAKKQAKEKEAGEDFEADDEAARKAWAENPGASQNKIIAIVRKVRKCSQGRAIDAARRTKPT